MTIQECIDIVENLKPSQYSTPDKVMWLSFIDAIIINDVLKTHEDYDGEYDTFVGYSPDHTDVALVVPSPYDRLYTAYLCMKIDEVNGETARYNNSATLFNSYLMEYKKYYNRTHLPLYPFNKRKVAPKQDKLSVTKAQLEALKDALYDELSDEMAGLDQYTPKITTVILKEANWLGEESPYEQKVAIEGITKNSKIDLCPSAEQLDIFHNKDLAFMVENNNGVVTVYCVGQRPTNDYSIQATVTEVATNG